MPVCQLCLKSYDASAPTPCKTHPGSWQGSERGKLHGTSSSDPCVAHLPLIAPDHPDVIRSRPGATYRMGRHERIFSLVLPVPPDALEKSVAYRELELALRQSPFGSKIAWDLLARRRAKLHATICGSLSKDEARERVRPACDEEQVLQVAGRGRYNEPSSNRRSPGGG